LQRCGVGSQPGLNGGLEKTLFQRALEAYCRGVATWAVGMALVISCRYLQPWQIMNGAAVTKTGAGAAGRGKSSTNPFM
jgi:hypothetical protein